MLLEEEDSRYYLEKTVGVNQTDFILDIFHVTHEDAGFYQCFSSPFVSADINVTVGG